MQRHSWMGNSWWVFGLVVTFVGGVLGCRGHQFGHVIHDNQSDLVGSHAAGAETMNPLVDEAVAKLLGRQNCSPSEPDHATGAGTGVKRVCFVGIENQSAEELGDFKEQIYEMIDSQIVNSGAFEPVSRRYVDAGLAQTRLRPDALFIPANMQTFASSLAQQGQPFDYLLFAKMTSGTTEKNRDYQRDYVLTLELVDVNTGKFDKESAKIRKGYHTSRLGKLRNFNVFTRQ